MSVVVGICTSIVISAFCAVGAYEVEKILK